MTYATHIEAPTTEALRDLLDRAGWTIYHAAKMIGMTTSGLSKAARGEKNLSGVAWRLLQLYASQAARDALPPAPLP